MPIKLPHCVSTKRCIL